MEQPWIDKPKTDMVFILAPAFFVVAVVFLFQDALQYVDSIFPFIPGCF
jgi:hypothetical protein